MPHPDPDRLVLLALDEQRPDAADTAHLDSCAHCREEVESLRAVAGLGREASAETSLPPVSEAVWERIAAETGQVSGPPSDDDGERVRELRRPGGERASGRRFSRYAVVAAAAAAVGVAGTLIIVNTGGGEDRVVAEAQLDPQVSAPAGATGRVRIVDSGSGALRLKVQLSGMPAPAGLYEIWLYDGGKTMIPLGVTAGTEAEVSVPPNLALSSYPVVDVSAQELGQQEHGVSMLQGKLRT
ncbi:anti-sigma factor domain-containing protein [Amycolatopsis sp. cg9]|uniref:anti-sigma factor domain-containing protein n=1 Tax=Amycolatopsis sp. cg9 TaxID=3238801 RepID=UPI0035263A1A